MENTPIEFDKRKFIKIASSEQIAKGIDLEDSIWNDCQFDKCDISGIYIAGATFRRCNFKETIFYWCSAFASEFIECQFTDCDLRGFFDGAKFRHCEFTNCKIGDDSLGGKTEWENAEAIDCRIVGNPLPIVFPNR
ncbi:MAG: pentapeptide repeat-containing protein [Verrucomicrobiota bacterium]